MGKLIAKSGFLQNLIDAIPFLLFIMDEDDFFRFTRRVDDALYRAKALGRNRVEVLAG